MHAPATAAASRDLDLDDIRTLIADDMAAVDSEIREQLHSDVALIGQVSQYIITSGGKRLRPMLVVLAARACGYSGADHIRAAAIIEFIHTATLLHDDVVDASEMRRGRETANNVWGNQASVLVGDFLYSRAFQMMVQINRMAVMQVLADATHAISEGEVLQLINTRDPETTQEQYLNVIRRKTARLFEAGTQIAAILTGQPPAIEQNLARFGMHLGTAFQLIDDVLDYSASPTKLGKNIGDDLAEGKPTLPLIYALREGSERQASVVREAILNGGLERIADVTEAVESTGALQYTAALAHKESDAALDALAPLPESDYKDALRALTRISVDRSY